MNVYFDTEFTGLHQNTTLVSIGMVADNGATFYAELTDYDKSQTDKWFEENVEEHLLYKNEEGRIRVRSKPYSISIKGSKEDVKNYLADWLSHFCTVQLVSDVCHYDMVLFISIFGTAFDIPSNVYPWCRDITQDLCTFLSMSGEAAFDLSREALLEEMKDSIPDEFPIEGKKHNALYDAKVIKAVDHLLMKAKEDQIDGKGIII